MDWALWIACFALALFSFRSLLGDFRWEGLSSRRRKLELIRARSVLHEIHARVEAGQVPEEALWDRALSLSPPWGRLAGEGLQRLRAAGAALLPTLKRFLALLEQEEEALGRARALSAQAWAQALSGIALVPLFALALWSFLPEARERAIAFVLLATGALAWACAGGGWILRLSEGARWAGLPEGYRAWVAASACAGERFLALLRSGSPPDLAWEGARDFLATEAPGLALRWGSSLWVSGEGDADLPPSGMAARFARAGEELRVSVQASILEGAPCAERAESILAGWRRDWILAVERSLQLLPQKALIPLFLCVAPPLLLLLAGALWFAARG